MVPNREIKADNTLVLGDDNYREGDIVSISQQKKTLEDTKITVKIQV